MTVASSLTGTTAASTTADLTSIATGTTSVTFTSGTIVSNAVSVRVSDAVPTAVVASFDKTTNIPGERATVTFTVSNASGPVPAGTYTLCSLQQEFLRL